MSGLFKESMRFKINFLKIVAALFFVTCLSVGISFAQISNNAPGAPGKDAQWASAGKQAIGTSASLESKVWFTLQGGALTDVYYPDVTVANVHKLEFVVVNQKTRRVETETEDATHEIKIMRPDSLSFQQTNTAKSGEWQIEKTYTTDPQNHSVLINVNFDTNNKDLKVYLYYDPSLSNTGMHDTAWSEGNVLFARDNDKFTALLINQSLKEFSEVSPVISSGYYKISDGLEELRKDGKLTNVYARAENGNVVQTAEVINQLFARKPSGPIKPKNNTLWNNQFSLVLGFGKTSDTALKTAQSSAQKGFQKSLTEYEKGWSDYVKTLPKVAAKYQAQFNMAAMVLKAQEDKGVRGANVASLTIPWGGALTANEDVGGGYHLVWSRDLYQVVTAYMALGDLAAANRALDFLFKIQQKPDGSFPQNSWLDGRPSWNSLQLDEVAYPLILAYQLKRFDKETWEKHVKKAADFIVKSGPKTVQERWEEKSGYSPSTIAAEIAGLVCAAEIAKKNGDEPSAAIYLATADNWARNVERWTATTIGVYGDGNYYLRLTENGTPDAGEKTVLNNNAGTFLEKEIVDAGFLELVRLGIKSPNDPLIEKSVKVIDQQLRVNTPNGEVFYRYNHDGYGEMDDGRRWNWDGKYTGKGRPWPLLTGERGQYELARGEKIKAQIRLDAMLGFANEGMMIPEQVWDKAETPANIDKQFISELKFGEGTGSATPLAWSMAQFIRLAVNLQAGKNLETPDVVYNRYVLGKKSEVESHNNGMIISQEDVDCLAKKGNHKYERFAQKFPVIKKCEGKHYAVFAFKETAKEVEIVGDFTNWKSFKNLLRQAEQCASSKEEYDTNKYISLEFKPTARVEYKFIVDGKWINDPLNPNKVDNGVGGENSFFTMPDYKPTNWDKGESVLLENIDFKSEILNGVRLLQTYVPAECSKNPCSVLYVQDGSDYIKRAKAVQIQESLAKAEKIKPFIMVFVDPKDRMKEYWASDDYAKFLATEVVPAIDAKYNTIKSRDGRAILGASLGGITSVHTALRYPETFSRVGGQSSSFWIDNERVVKELEKLNFDKTPFRFYFDVGTLEGVENSRRVNVLLRGKGFPITYEETESGHNWTAWRDRLANAYVGLWQN